MPGRDAQHSTCEVILLTTYASLCWLFDDRLALDAADFPAPPPRHLFELRTLFAGRVRFNRQDAALRFDPRLQGLQVARRADEIARFLRRVPASLLEALFAGNHATTQVRKVIHDALPQLLSLEQVADHLAMSTRTLHRRLGAEGENFQKIKDELRRDLALGALARSDAPLKQIAVQLGFADQASFNRAFLAWTGVQPGAWRKRALKP